MGFAISLLGIVGVLDLINPETGSIGLSPRERLEELMAGLPGSPTLPESVLGAIPAEPFGAVVAIIIGLGVLTVIGANPGLSQMAVANRLGIERARLVHLLNELESRKLVKRIKSKTDRRSHALHLTDQGETALARFKRLAAEHERHVEDRIGKANRKRLLAMLAGFS